MPIWCNVNNWQRSFLYGSLSITNGKISVNLQCKIFFDNKNIYQYKKLCLKHENKEFKSDFCNRLKSTSRTCTGHMKDRDTPVENSEKIYFCWIYHEFLYRWRWWWLWIFCWSWVISFSLKFCWTICMFKISFPVFLADKKSCRHECWAMA